MKTTKIPAIHAGDRIKIKHGQKLPTTIAAIRNGLIGEGYADYEWRFSVESVSRMGYNHAACTVYVYKPHKQKPCVGILVIADAVRRTVDFKSTEIIYFDDKQ